MKQLPWRERIPKLPKWAQQYIDKLEKDIVVLEEERERVESGETAIYWSIWPGDEHYLPDRAAFTVYTEHGIIEVSLRDGKLRVYGYSGRLIVRPEVTNVITVEVEKR